MYLGIETNDDIAYFTEHAKCVTGKGNTNGAAIQIYSAFEL